MDKCFNCNKLLHFLNKHEHHVVPNSLGGTATVLLCNSCHSLVHSANLMSHSELTKKGLDSKIYDSLTAASLLLMQYCEFDANNLEKLKRSKSGSEWRKFYKWQTVNFPESDFTEKDLIKCSIRIIEVLNNDDFAYYNFITFNRTIGDNTRYKINSSVDTLPSWLD